MMLRCEKGFTFIELVVVMVVISIILGISAPQLAAFYRGVKLDNTLRQTVILLERAREAALSSRVPCVVSVDQGWRMMVLGLERDKGEVEPLEGVSARLELKAGIELTAIAEGGRHASTGARSSFKVLPLVNEQEVELRFGDEYGNTGTVRMMAGGGRIEITY